MENTFFENIKIGDTVKIEYLRGKIENRIVTNVTKTFFRVAGDSYKYRKKTGHYVGAGTWDWFPRAIQ